MRYRYSIGKYKGSNIVNDPNFATGCGGGNWNCGANWSIAAGVATHTNIGLGGDGFLYQSGVFDPGSEYSIEIVVTAASNGHPFWVYCGEWFAGFSEQAETLVINNVKNLSNYDKLTVAGVIFNAGAANSTITEIKAYEWFWNSPIDVEPGDWDESKLVMTESTIIDGFVTEFVGNLKFISDGYDYLLSVSSNLGTKEPILIEYYDTTTKTWKELFEGSINISELEIDYEKKIISADIEQAGAGNYMRTQVEDKFINSTMQQTITSLAYSVDNTPAWQPGYDRVMLHDAATGANTIQIPVAHQYRGLKDHMVRTSKTTLLPQSTFLSNVFLDDGGVDIWLGMFRGAQYLGTPLVIPTTPPEVSTREFLENYNVITNMGFWYAKDANDIPTFYIEDLATIIDRNPTYTFDNVKLEPMKASWPTEPKRIDTGYPNTYDGSDELYHYISQEPALTETLTIQPDWSRHTSIFQDLNPGANQQYAQNVMFLEYYDAAGSWFSRRYGAARSYDRLITGDLYIDNWTDQLATVYESERGGTASGPLADPLIREFEFNYPITFAQFEHIRAFPFEYIAFNGFGVDTQGLPKRMEYPLKNDANGDAIARFKILAE